MGRLGPGFMFFGSGRGNPERGRRPERRERSHPLLYIGTREVEFAAEFENISVMGFEMGSRGYG
jgi:hypothetical protein